MNKDGELPSAKKLVVEMNEIKKSEEIWTKRALGKQDAATPESRCCSCVGTVLKNNARK
jgi:hypothetical protein